VGVHDVGPIAVDKLSHLWMPGAPTGAVDWAVRIDAESKCHCRALSARKFGCMAFFPGPCPGLNAVVPFRGGPRQPKAYDRSDIIHDKMHPD